MDRRVVLAAGLGLCVGGCGAKPAAGFQPMAAASPDQALARLKAGNAAYVKGGGRPPDTSHDRIATLARGQKPFAVILSCSDSRAPPEHVFHDGLGELFVIRVAGNTLDAAELGSIEYAVAELGAPLVAVMGHERCGAVSAAVAYDRAPGALPGSLHAVVDPILPAVAAAKAQDPPDLVEAAVIENVRLVTARLRASQAVLAPALAAGRLKVVGLRYDLDDGRVRFDVA